MPWIETSHRAYAKADDGATPPMGRRLQAQIQDDGKTVAIVAVENAPVDYSEEDQRWVEYVTCMRGAGLSFQVLGEYVTLFQQGDKFA